MTDYVEDRLNELGISSEGLTDSRLASTSNGKYLHGIIFTYFADWDSANDEGIDKITAEGVYFSFTAPVPRKGEYASITRNPRPGVVMKVTTIYRTPTIPNTETEAYTFVDLIPAN